MLDACEVGTSSACLAFWSAAWWACVAFLLRALALVGADWLIPEVSVHDFVGLPNTMAIKMPNMTAAFHASMFQMISMSSFIFCLLSLLL